jgi:hypothetical protein
MKMPMKCEVEMDGPGPSEKIVNVVTIHGKMELIVDEDCVTSGNLLRVESVLKKNSSMLVELPRETTSGQTRVWVATADTIQEAAQ